MGFSHYTEEQIEAARKLQKKNGLSFMENLRLVAPAVENNMAAKDILDSVSSDFSNLFKKNNEDLAELTKMVQPKSTISDPTDISSMIDGLNSSIKKDFDISATPAPAAPITEVDTTDIFAKFKGVDEVIKEKVYGQDDFVKKLIVAFKRPYVSANEDGALNSIFITGAEDTGKHFTLYVLLDELKNRGILPSNEMHVMDLSIYQSAAEETVFIQDLYNALCSKSSVILFENYEKCNVALLSKLSDLVINGECRLSDRYLMKNGQLISVSNSLAGGTVSSLKATNKYLIFISNGSVDKLSNAMGAPFINALGDICATASLDDSAYTLIAEKEEEVLGTKCKKQLAYNLTVDEKFRAYACSQTDKGRALSGIRETYANAFKALSEYRLESDDIDVTDIILSIENDIPVIKMADKTVSLSDLLPTGYSGEIDSINKEIEKIVGLKEIKEYIFSLKEYYGIQKKRSEAGLKAGEVNKHMIFTGNPGTGKTTIARIVSKYLKAIGVLTGGQLVEVSRADLVGRYVGHTAPLVNQVIKSALGGVLFIDEAYSLYRGKDDSFGMEAIDTLVKGIEDNRDNLVVILAGYSKEMSEFLEANSGLKSRFPNIIDFPDYTGEELCEITKITASSKGYVIEDGAFEALLDYYNAVQATNPREAGNGRLVRNKVEEAILNQSKRLVVEQDADMSTLLLTDFEL